MSTIPITFDERKIPYTVLGGIKRGGEGSTLPVTVVLISRGDRFSRQQAVRDLVKIGFHDVLSIEEPQSALETDGFVNAYPSVRFLVPGEPVTLGEMVNLGMKEASSEAVLVLMSDMKIAQAGISIRFFDKFMESGALCWAPAISLPEGAPLPSIIVPAFSKKGLKLMQVAPSAEAEPTLFPYDYSGVYHKEKFIMLGGYDYTLKNSYWQKADFGFRAHLWGEAIQKSPSIKVSYANSPAAEDSTFDQSYKRFYLKNLAISFSGDSGRLPISSYPSYCLKSGGNPLLAWKEFSQARDWVRINRYRFKSDAKSIVELWGGVTV